jgi:hypothetical protein
VAGRAIARSDGGYALTPTFYLPDSSGVLTPHASCSGPCIVNGDDVYLSANQSARKFAIAYQLGWVMLDAMGGPTVDDSRTFWRGNCVGSGDQNLGSLEESNFAAAAGFAHLYAAFAFNLPGDTCGYTYWRAMNWDDMGPPCFDADETSASEPMSCATGRAPLVPPRNHRSFCELTNATVGDIGAGTTTEKVSVAVDYQRMWWELLSGYSYYDACGSETTVTLALGDIIDMYEGAIAGGWPSADHVDFGSYLPAGITSGEWQAVTDRHGVPRP